MYDNNGRINYIMHDKIYEAIYKARLNYNKKLRRK